MAANKPSGKPTNNKPVNKPTNKPSYATIRNQRVIEATRSIVSELPNAAFDYMLSIADTMQPLTRYAYAYDLRLFFHYLQKENPRFANKDLITWTDDDFRLITQRDVSLFMDYLTLYFNEEDLMTTNQELGKQRKFYSVRAFFKWLFKQGRIPSDVTALVDAPKRHEKPILRLDIDEVNKMLKTVESGENLSAQQQKFNKATSVRDKAIILLFLGTGIRVSELVGLNIEDMNLENASFLVTRKGGNQAILYLPEEIIPALNEYMELRNHIETVDEDDPALFLSLQRRRITVRSVENMVKKYALAAAPLKKRISPHKLRSTFGTNLYNETGDIYLVADVLGHSDINTTRRHYAAMNEDRRKYAATRVKIGSETPASTEKNDENGPK